MSLVVVEAAVDVRRSPEDVFDYCSDPSREPEWNPMMKRIVKVTDAPIGVGARYMTEFAEGLAMVLECVGYNRSNARPSRGIRVRSRLRGRGASCRLQRVRIW